MSGARRRGRARRVAQSAVEVGRPTRQATARRVQDRLHWFCSQPKSEPLSPLPWDFAGYSPLDGALPAAGHTQAESVSRISRTAQRISPRWRDTSQRTEQAGYALEFSAPMMGLCLLQALSWASRRQVQAPGRFSLQALQASSLGPCPWLQASMFLSAHRPIPKAQI
eukprot:gene29647-36725_t